MSLLYSIPHLTDHQNIICAHTGVMRQWNKGLQAQSLSTTQFTLMECINVMTTSSSIMTVTNVTPNKTLLHTQQEASNITTNFTDISTLTLPSEELYSYK